MARVNPEMIALARESRGYTQKEFADVLGVSQGRLSKIEMGLAPVPDEFLSDLSDQLRYPAAFFSESACVYATGLTLHRKRASLPKRTLERIQAQLTIRKFHIVKLLDDITFPGDKIPSYVTSSHITPSSIARKVRASMGIPKGPISGLVPYFEKAGILIIPCDLEHRFIDAVSCRVEGLPPTVFINSSSPGDRQRFTLAHELGHLVMHQAPSEDMEAEADEFASEFLMPREDITGDLFDLNMHKLWELKSRWKVSMAALVMRASHLKCIGENRARYLWVQLSKAGYRLEEPLSLAIQPEKPTFINKIIELNLEDRTVTELSELLCLEKTEFRTMYMGGEEKKKRKVLNI